MELPSLTPTHNCEATAADEDALRGLYFPDLPLDNYTSERALFILHFEAIR